MRTSTITLLLAGLFTSLVTGAACPGPRPTDPGEISTADGPFTIIVFNATYPYIDGKFLWYNSGITYLDRGVQNPRYSYPISAKLENNKLTRIPVSGDPGAASVIGNLNFGTSGVCCSYARLQWHSTESLPATSRTSPFYIDAGGYLVWEQAPYRQPWYLCGKTVVPPVGTNPSDPGEERILYTGLPFYEYQGKPENYCIAVKLAIVRPVDI